MAKTAFHYQTGRVIRKPEDRQSRHDTPLRLYRAHGKRIAALERECKALRNELNRVRFKKLR